MRACSPRAFLILFLLAASSHQLHAQLSARVATVSPQDGIADMPLTVRVELRQGETIERVYFIYRPFTESDWTQLEMDVRGNSAYARLPASDVLPPFLEYYLVMVFRSGGMESHPLSESTNPLERPPSRTLRLPVTEKDDDVQAVFLSPEANATFIPEDVLVSLSLFRADSIVVRRATRLLVDGADVTEQAVLSDDMLTYIPSNVGVRLAAGRHKATVILYDRQGNMHRQIDASFMVVSQEQMQVAPSPDGFLYSGAVDLEFRREKVGSAAGRLPITWYNRGGARFSGKQGDWRIAANLFLTSDEASDRQPQHRYYVALESPWLLVGYGDNYPLFPSLVLNGKRVRGLNSSLRLGKFNVDLAWGKTLRAVQGTLLKEIPINNLEAEQRADRFAAYARITPETWGKFSYGTYARDILAVRPSFGSGEKYQIGFTWLKSKDDITSVRYGTRPQENLVLGTDIISKFDQGRIELTGQLAFSAYNSDISSGNFTDTYIDTVYKKDAAAIKDARDILKQFITVNDNLRPLSFRKLSTLAYETALSLNYFDNAFKASYLFRGSDYTSFGQTFLRNDVAGFSLLDRVRLLRNELVFTLGFERLHDNTSAVKAATTHFTTFNLAATYDPRNGMPSVTVGYNHYANANGLVSPGQDSISTVDDQTNRVFFLAHHQFQYFASHDATASISTSNRADYTVRKLNVRNMSVSFTLNTTYSIPLQTTVGYTSNVNRFPSVVVGRTMELNYSTVMVAGNYTFDESRFVVGSSVSPTFGDFNRLALDATGQWNVTPYMHFILQYSFFANEGSPNDDFWSLQYRYEY